MEEEKSAEHPEKLARIDLRSAAFGSGKEIDGRHSRAGGNVSQRLEWTKMPPNTQSFAVICEDPDAPGDAPFVHWLIYDIPGGRNVLPENLGSGDLPTDLQGAAQGMNDFGTVGYGGPEPPEGDGPHRYFFRIYALDRVLRLQPGVSKGVLFAAMKGQAIGYGEVLGTYERRH